MRYITLFLSISITLVFSSPAHAQADRNRGTIKGQTIDRETEDPLGFVYLYLEELDRAITAHGDGAFTFNNIPAGEYTLSASRIGYQSVTQVITVNSNETTALTLSLRPSVLNAQAVEVIGTADHASSANLEHASKTIKGADLRQNLGTTLSSTMEEMPGISSRSMGSAPARPIIRGLGGERLLILQDGERTGDVSSQSADHAVTVDPMAAEEIEIARGPAALEYGANAIGGVINVVRNQISPTLPDHLHGTASLEGQSVNTGGVAAVNAGIPLGSSLALNFDGNLRSAQNLKTPEGSLQNSDIFSTNNSVGLSSIHPWGYAGLAGSMYLTNYGIPPDPAGGHEHGVNIEVRKYQTEGRAEITLDNPVFKSVQANLSYKNYYHRELEEDGQIGTEYGLLTTNAKVAVRHQRWGFLEQGKIGFWGEAKDYAVDGTQTPGSDAYSLASFAIEEKNIGALHLEVGARFELSRATPEEQYESSIGRIRERTFYGLATSASAIYDIGSGFFTGATFMHSFRPPSQEELYSEGPHLASYSYEVGNPDLNPERGLGKELFICYKSSSATAEVGVYHNSFNGYIYPRNTGQQSARFPSLNVYQFSGVDARFRGIEFSSQVSFWDHWALTGSMSYTHAQREIETAGWQPLPMIPPLQAHINLKYASGGFHLGGKITIADRQDRTGDFETPTSGYTVAGLFGQYRFESARLLHTISLNADNIFNTTYRNHLSRIKELMPEPARNISILYRMYF
ncbi:TonB-dependent receptor [Fodinibius sediminis]|uniref:Iron complex outermembrane recepter protein n=1 Tax=Fodinibius sediminis TaxID=1214077 RepID=A0A521D9K3_9BACT|nr:TonB-dependent receptor [Fodinibius sediminis]SMO68315.1 iron complex outermembrane recepter protein [Fodinibius sediminis]